MCNGTVNNTNPCLKHQCSHWMEVSDVHTNLGEAFGFVCWMWIFHRARNDLPVVLGWRHPWEHAEDPWAANVPKEDDIEGIVELRAEWEKFNASATNPEEDVSKISVLLLCLSFQTYITSVSCRTMKTKMMMMMMMSRIKSSLVNFEKIPLVL